MADPDRRSTLLASYENAAVIVSAIDFERLGHPTPCPKYDVAGLIDHLVEAGHRAAALGRGQAPRRETSPLMSSCPTRPLSYVAPPRRRREAWADEAALSSRFTMPWGEEYTGATLVDMYLAELAAHAWDLARGHRTARQVGPLPRAAGARWGAGHDQTRSTATWSSQEPRSGPEVPPPPGADDWERLAAFMGRDPRASLGR